VTSLDDLPIRDDLRGHTPYGAPQKSVRIALNVNENTHPIPEAVAQSIVEALASAILQVNRYPAANGSNEVLQQILQAFGGPGRSVLGFPPTYSMHSIIASGTGTRWIEGVRDDEYRISPQTAVRWVTETSPDIVFFCSPNNPTGTPLSLETIAAAYEATDGIVVVDEAYAEFAQDGVPTALSLLEGRERLIVSRTMSKAFAFAGARVGYMAADPAVTDALRLVRLPYHLSALTQAAAVAALAHTPEMLAMVDDIKAQRDRLLRELPKLGYTVHDSAANFVLFGGVADPNGVFEALLERDIIIRDLKIDGHLRVTAGTEAETTAFLSALAKIDV
jgi:histidinol-phosphate aminotransferase